MLSIFPDLLSLHLIVPTIIRLTIGFFALTIIFKILPLWSGKWTKLMDWLIGLALTGYAIGGVLLIIGLFTQIIGPIMALISLFFLFLSYRQDNYFNLSPEFFCLMAIISLTLLISGAGWGALDLPF